MKGNPAATARERQLECLIESEAFQLRLRTLKWTNWITVILPALLSTAAGAGILTGASGGWLYAAGVATLVASLFVVLHKALNCDYYQAEANRLRKSYDGLATEYRTIAQRDSADAESSLLALERRLAITREHADVTIPPKYRARARERVYHEMPGLHAVRDDAAKSERTQPV
jgi:hypothetical protein